MLTNEEAMIIFKETVFCMSVIAEIKYIYQKGYEQAVKDQTDEDEDVLQ